MRCGVDSLEDMSERTLKASGVWPVNTSADSTVSNGADTVIVLCVTVKNKRLAMPCASLPISYAFLQPILTEAAVLCHQRRGISFLEDPRSTTTCAAPIIPLFISRHKSFFRRLMGRIGGILAGYCLTLSGSSLELRQERARLINKNA